ncbi:hypothetical protein [Methylobacterium oxalidis]|uniref:Uncharacterized protein n=1 Tax=Methylobacterium oxalidis TaxID=944322 RepID=A0A512J1T6_9HYPH|nr:hypothetical protein [Methylobacterium oxalidis]GEP03932.1 hypothetical protein MOX02_19700 [Methylobacterium oxalidis]GLS63964.1 hypothetical protein GCM10007888_23450 [Methylobacterium oxalidis]
MANGCCEAGRGGRRPFADGAAGRLARGLRGLAGDLALVGSALGLALILIVVGA